MFSDRLSEEVEVLPVVLAIPSRLREVLPVILAIPSRLHEGLPVIFVIPSCLHEGLPVVLVIPSYVFFYSSKGNQRKSIFACPNITAYSGVTKIDFF